MKYIKYIYIYNIYNYIYIVSINKLISGGFHYQTLDFRSGVPTSRRRRPVRVVVLSSPCLTTLPTKDFHRTAKVHWYIVTCRRSLLVARLFPTSQVRLESLSIMHHYACQVYLTTRGGTFAAMKPMSMPIGILWYSLRHGSKGDPPTRVSRPHPHHHWAWA